MDDPRFKHLASDPRFKAIPKRSRKVTIDSRFQSMFTDEAFKVKYKVDKRGRKVEQTSSEDLRKYYRLDDDGAAGKEGEEEVEKDWGVKKSCVARKRRQLPAIAGEGGSDSDGGGQQEESDKAHSDTDPDMPDQSSASDTPSSATSDSDSDDDFEYQHGKLSALAGAIEGWSEEAGNVPLSEETSHRLAVCNMDWDHVGARDIFVLLNSFKPAGASVLSVKVFPSDFGMERLAREEVEGPVSLSSPSSRDGQDCPGSCDQVANQSGEGDEYSKEKLRKYQLSRFKYYYAVVECDSRATAEHIYRQCNGLEYEHSGGQLDLRFIPDEMEFDDREPTSTATEATATADFTPVDFVSSALQQSKVKLTWDETDPRRVKMTQRKFTKDDLQSMNFNAYLASSSDSSSEGEGEGTGESKALRYKSLLEGAEQSVESPAEEMEISWEPGLKESVEKMVKKKKKSEGVTPWEQYLLEKKEKRKAAKHRKQQGAGKAPGEEGSEEKSAGNQGFDDPFFEHSVTTATAGTTKKKGRRRQGLEEDKLKEKEELELLMLSDGEMEGGGKEHFNLPSILRAEQTGTGKKGKGKRRKRRREEQEEGPGIAGEFKVDVDDPRFKALYESHLFAPDPSAPQYKATKGMAEIMEERRKRQVKKKSQQDPATGQTVSDTTSLTNLVSSVKVKAKSFKAKKRKLKLKSH